MIKVAKKCTNHGMFTWRGKRNMPTYRRYINQGRIKVAKKCIKNGMFTWRGHFLNHM